MWRFEILYRENGILKHRGFGHKEKFDKFRNKLRKKKDVQVVSEFDAERGVYTKY